ncbi:hypothetical protein EWB00_001056 [Schistosoma japonicum]|uniref:Ran-binding protein n=2 Tax=Schistosoma japonicum TaxID=6182 RepID=A0A4Z2DHB4_SCHJA|nr:hypothetical protein EWB00_001056 [Schistosoma japonicum]
MAFALDDDKRCQLNEDIIKQLYLVAYMQGSRLPTCLVTNSKCSKVQVRGDGRTAVDMRSHVHQTVLPVVIKADHPIPVSCSVYYFEITVNVKSRSGLLALGVCSSRSSTNEWPGMEFTSYGYHSNSGTIYHNSKELPISAPSFGESDIIGCGVNFVNNSVFFTKNGVFIGPISAGKKLPHPVYPCIAFACPNCHVSINFGHHKFAYNIGQYIARERAVAISTAVDRKCNDQLAYVTMRNLVATYLLHNGFLESAQALGEWVTKASNDSSSSVIEENNLVFDNVKNQSYNVNGNNDCETNSISSLKSSQFETPNNCLPSINKHICPTNSMNGISHSDNSHNINSNHYTTDNNTSSTFEGLNCEPHQQQKQQSKLPTPPPITNQHLMSATTTNEMKSSKDTILNDLFRWPEAVDILLRRRHLRETIRNGDYLSALEQLKTHFKTLWENDPSITFVLKCHHFIDLIRQHYTTSSSKESVSLNGSSDNYRKTLHCNSLDTTHRNSQKRMKPCSFESSPEAITPNEHDCHYNHHLINSNLNHIHHSTSSELSGNVAITNTIDTNSPLINRSSSCCLTSNTVSYNHSHAPSNYQPPIRFRFDLSGTEWNDGLLTSTTDKCNYDILPSVFPKNCPSLNDGPISNGTAIASSDCTTTATSNSSSNNTSSNSSEIICPALFPVYTESNHIKTTDNRTSIRPYRSDQHIFNSCIQYLSLTGMKLESHFEGLKMELGLIDPVSYLGLGNEYKGLKCLTVIRRRGSGGGNVRGRQNQMHSNKLRSLSSSSSMLSYCNHSYSTSNSVSFKSKFKSHSHYGHYPPPSINVEKQANHQIMTNGNSVHSPIDDSTPLHLSKTNSVHENNIKNKQNGECLHSINSNGICHDSINSNDCNNYFDDGSVDYQSPNDELRDLIEYGRNLRTTALDLQNQGVISLEQLLLLSNAFSLVAYQNPYKSPLSSLLHPKYRELLADAVNDAILVHLKQPCRPVLDIALTYLEHVLTDDGSSCKTTGSVAFYRFKSGQTNTSGLPTADPLQNITTTPQLQSDDVYTTSRINQTTTSETIIPVSHDTPTTPNRTIAIGIVHRDNDNETRHVTTTDVQTYALSLNDFNGSTNLLRPASASVISSSLYVPPSALISLTGRSNPITRNSDSQRSSLRGRPTSLQNLIQQRHQTQTTEHQTTSTTTTMTVTAATSTATTTSSGSSTSSPSHFNRFLVTTSNWPISSAPFSSSSSSTTTTTTTTTTQNSNHFPPSRSTVTSTLTNTHAPTGPELAGFFHPILFIG